MKKRWFTVIVIVLLVSGLVTGCGVSKAQYDAVTTELDTAKQERQAAQDELQATQSELSKTKLDLQTAQADLLKTQGQLDTTQEQLKAAQADLQATQAQLQTSQTAQQSTQTQLQTTQTALAKTKTDLQTSQAQVQSLQQDIATLNEKRAEVLTYAELIDVVMFEVWLSEKFTPRFDFSSLNDNKAAAYEKAMATGNADMVDLVTDIYTTSGSAWDFLYKLQYLSLGVIEDDMK
jgi:predicted RNase H-like nuclease (RuvC/YqgF family)